MTIFTLALRLMATLPTGEFLPTTKAAGVSAMDLGCVLGRSYQSSDLWKNDEVAFDILGGFVLGGFFGVEVFVCVSLLTLLFDSSFVVLAGMILVSQTLVMLKPHRTSTSTTCHPKTSDVYVCVGFSALAKRQHQANMVGFSSQV